jgi:hypothetical protein
MSYAGVKSGVKARDRRKHQETQTVFNRIEAIETGRRVTDDKSKGLKNWSFSAKDVSSGVRGKRERLRVVIAKKINACTGKSWCR